MRRFFVVLAVALVGFSCSTSDDEAADEEIVIETLTGSSFTLSQFEAYTFPATDVWVIDDSSAVADDFAGLSAALEYISNYETSRAISLEFPSLEAIPAYAVFGASYANASRSFSALSSVSAPVATSVGSYAFEYCSSLATISIPAVESVGGYAFNGCTSLEALSLPVAQSIEFAAFNNCSSLASVELPLVESLGDQAFRLCSSIVSLDLPLLQSIASSAFAYCTSLEQISIPLVLTIGDAAFCECVALSSLEFPSLEQIGSTALIACSLIESITLPSTLSEVGDGLFSSCSSLTELIVESADFVYDSGVLYNADRSKVVGSLCAVVEGDVALDASVVELSPRAFYDCDGITSLTLSSISDIPQWAFAFCDSLETASLSEAASLQESSFYECVALSDFAAPKLTTIATHAFYNCNKITTLSIATMSDVELESIATGAFESGYLLATTLTVGVMNSEYVLYGDILSIGTFYAEFDEIILLEE